MRTLAGRTDALLFLLFSSCCAKPRASPEVPLQPDALTPTQAVAPTCEPRVAGAASESTQASDFAVRVQQKLSLRYPGRQPSEVEAMEPDATEPEQPLAERLAFALVSQRWGAEGPVPWEEVVVPALDRFVGPVALYGTELCTYELEYPWVAALVVAREVDGEIELEVLLHPNFTSTADRLAALLKGACAPSEARALELTRIIATLYALGDSSRVTEATREGSCLISEFHLYGDEVWRHVAVAFDPAGVVQNVHDFNPKDESDSALRASVCAE